MHQPEACTCTGQRPAHALVRCMHMHWSEVCISVPMPVGAHATPCDRRDDAWDSIRAQYALLLQSEHIGEADAGGREDLRAAWSFLEKHWGRKATVGDESLLAIEGHATRLEAMVIPANEALNMMEEIMAEASMNAPMALARQRDAAEHAEQYMALSERDTCTEHEAADSLYREMKTELASLCTMEQSMEEEESVDGEVDGEGEDQLGLGIKDQVQEMKSNVALAKKVLATMAANHDVIIRAQQSTAAAVNRMVEQADQRFHTDEEGAVLVEALQTCQESTGGRRQVGA